MFIEAYPNAELPGLTSVPVSDFIPGDTSGLRVPLYDPYSCPERTRLRAGDYLSAFADSGYVLPVYSSPAAMMSRDHRPVSALTPLGP